MQLMPDGWKECSHCNGHGSSLKDPEGVDQCTVCHEYQGQPGWMPGLVPNNDQCIRKKTET